MDGAPTTFFDVERERRWRIWLLFAILVALFFVGVWLVVLCVGLAASLLLFDTRALLLTFTAPGLAILLLAAVALAWVYWRLSRTAAQERLLAAMHAQPLDPHDRYHQRLKHIVEEMAIAGGCGSLRCMVVPTLGMNAFAISDFHGGGTIGVTEGALARLTRQQLTGVVAHEVAHILSGDCAMVTAACLLFGVYSSAVSDLGDIGAGIDGERAGDTSVPAAAVIAPLALASALINGAISRQREFRADAAAVRYTRDPLGLAQALGMMVRHPGGAGYIPPGLAALCIRPIETSSDWLESLAATHPPTDKRIAALLRLAAASPQSFVTRSTEEEAALERREHLVAPPARRVAVGDGPITGGALGQVLGAAIGAASGDGAGERGAVASVAGAAGAVGPRCPSCGATLRPVDYEGMRILACAACDGRLVSSANVAKILARREVGFGDEQRRLAAEVVREGDHLRRRAVLARGREKTPPRHCPLCGRTMMRRHFNLQYAVEVDLCLVCDRLWFEKDELEVLQVMVEGQVG